MHNLCNDWKQSEIDVYKSSYPVLELNGQPEQVKQSGNE